jgi:site-specific DNA-methyltransferase (adenine-specific)
MSVIRGDCVEVMAGMEPDSVDAVVCDPPYDLVTTAKPGYGGGGATDTPGGRLARGFMGREWDGTGVAFDPATWAAALRVAKPGAYLLAFGGTRTVHRMTCALEDAGWVIRDMLVWAYAQGFPKSRASLKPAWEPIVMARKPGASRDLNIDAARIGTTKEVPASVSQQKPNAQVYGKLGIETGAEDGHNPNVGRWPSNVLLTSPILDGGWDGVVGGGEQSGGGNPARRGQDAFDRSYSGGWNGGDTGLTPSDTSGTYSRFFMLPKAPTRERVLSDGRRSPHPTQKPEALIRHLVTLVTPPDGLVLDPFLGSGTLGVVCDGLGVRWLGIEREPEYAQWAEDRIDDKRPEWTAA